MPRGGSCDVAKPLPGVLARRRAGDGWGGSGGAGVTKGGGYGSLTTPFSFYIYRLFCSFHQFIARYEGVSGVPHPPVFLTGPRELEFEPQTEHARVRVPSAR